MSGELIVGDGKGGVWKTRTVHRKPPSERWDPKTIDFVRHPPWRTCDDDTNADGEMPDGVPCALANCPGIVVSPAGILISFPFVVLPGINFSIRPKVLGKT